MLLVNNPRRIEVRTRKMEEAARSELSGGDSGGSGSSINRKLHTQESAFKSESEGISQTLQLLSPYYYSSLIPCPWFNN